MLKFQINYLSILPSCGLTRPAGPSFSPARVVPSASAGLVGLFLKLSKTASSGGRTGAPYSGDVSARRLRALGREPLRRSQFRSSFHFVVEVTRSITLSAMRGPRYGRQMHAQSAKGARPNRAVMARGLRHPVSTHESSTFFETQQEAKKNSLVTMTGS
jgi:hypothetical protein